MLDDAGKLSSASRAGALVRCLRLMASLLVGSPPSHPGHAHDRTVRPERVLSVVTADWHGDGFFDRALLIASETEPDQADLLGYLAEATDPMRLAVNKPNIAWRGAMGGTQPALELTGRGALVIMAANEAIGRNRWPRKLTVGYRDQSFVVAGDTYTERDTFAAGASSSGDIKLLTGEGVKHKQSFRTSARAVALADWSEVAMPQECR